MHIDRWMDKENVVYIHNGTLLRHKKWNLATYDKMDGPREFYDKSDRKRQILCDFTYMYNLKNKTNEQIQQNRNSHRNRKQTSSCQREGVREWKIGEGD